MTSSTYLQIAAGMVVPMIIIFAALMKSKSKIALSICLSVLLLTSAGLFAASFFAEDYVAADNEKLIELAEGYLENRRELPGNLINVNARAYSRLLGYSEAHPLASDRLKRQSSNVTGAELYRRLTEALSEDLAVSDRLYALEAEIGTMLGYSYETVSVTKNNHYETYIQTENKKNTTLGDYVFSSYTVNEGVLSEYVGMNYLNFIGQITYTRTGETYEISAPDGAFVKIGGDSVDCIELFFEEPFVLGQSTVIDKIRIGNLVLEDPQITVYPKYIDIVCGDKASRDDSVRIMSNGQSSTALYETLTIIYPKSLSAMLSRDAVHFKISENCVIPSATLYHESGLLYPPEINIFSGFDDTYNVSTHITGMSAPGTKLHINGIAVEVGADGAFSYDIDLKRGENKIVLESVGKDKISMARRDATITRLSAETKIFRLYEVLPNIFAFLLTVLNVSFLIGPFLQYLSELSLNDALLFYFKILIAFGLFSLTFVLIQPFFGSEAFAAVAANNAYSALKIAGVKMFFSVVSAVAIAVSIFFYLSTIYITRKRRQVKHRR